MKKTIFITGASSGIGKATSLYFAEQGWNVIATMRNPSTLSTAQPSAAQPSTIQPSTTQPNANHPNSTQPNIFVTRLDVSDPASIEKAIQDGIEKFGHIDALVNNAGYGQQGLFEAVTPEKIKEQFEVNVFGVMNVTRAILPHFRSRHQGILVNVTSGAGRVTTPLLSIYAASKFAAEGFSESLAYELESQNIKVKIIEPGYIKTPFYERAVADFAFDPSLTDYSEFSTRMAAFFQSFESSNNATAADVAKDIYQSVTDGTQRLRYVIGPDLEPLMHMRNSMPDQAYVESMRKLFMPKA